MLHFLLFNHAEMVLIHMVQNSAGACCAPWKTDWSQTVDIYQSPALSLECSSCLHSLAAWCSPPSANAPFILCLPAPRQQASTFVHDHALDGCWSCALAAELFQHQQRDLIVQHRSPAAQGGARTPCFALLHQQLLYHFTQTLHYPLFLLTPALLILPDLPSSCPLTSLCPLPSCTLQLRCGLGHANDFSASGRPASAPFRHCQCSRPSCTSS